MSKIGMQPIKVSSTVIVSIQDRSISVKSGQNELNYLTPVNLEVNKETDVLLVRRLKEDKKTRSLHGLFRTLLYNAIVGVEKPWEKKLEIVGTGFNVKLQGEDLVFKLGFSHPVVFKHIQGLKYTVSGANKLTVAGPDKQLVGQTAYQIKLIKKPDAYKGKGIRYSGEQIKLKPGKKAKVGTAA